MQNPEVPFDMNIWLFKMNNVKLVAFQSAGFHVLGNASVKRLKVSKVSQQFLHQQTFPFIKYQTLYGKIASNQDFC